VLANMSSLEKAEIAQDALAILLGGEPAARPARPDWQKTTFTPDRAVWAGYVGEYQTSDGSIRVYREGDRLLSAGGGVPVTNEFVPLSDTRFVMPSEVRTLGEESAEFQRQADGSVVLLFRGQPPGLKP
jgi:hypothetical protein